MKKSSKIIALALVFIVIVAAAVTVYAVGYDSSEDPIVALSFITDVFKPQIETMISNAKSELTTAITNLKNEISSKLTSLEGKDNQIGELLEGANSEIAELESSVSGLTENDSALESELADAKNKNEELNAKLDELESQITELESQINDDPNNTPIYNFEVVYLKQGESLMATAACEIILRSGEAIAISPFDSQGVADYTSGSELLNGYALTLNHLNLVPRGNDGRGIMVTSYEAYFMVRGGYTVVTSE